MNAFTLKRFFDVVKVIRGVLFFIFKAAFNCSECLCQIEMLLQRKRSQLREDP